MARAHTREVLGHDARASEMMPRMYRARHNAPHTCALIGKFFVIGVTQLSGMHELPAGTALLLPMQSQARALFREHIQLLYGDPGQIFNPEVHAVRHWAHGRQFIATDRAMKA